MKKHKLSFLIIILIIIIMISIIIFKLINDKIAPIIMDYSVSEMKRIATIIINRSINSDLLKDIDMNNLFIITKEDNDEVTTISLDSVIVNQITDAISDACEDNLRLIEEGKYGEIKDKFNIEKEYFYVPSGVLTKNTILNSIGPKIPISLKIIGNVTSGLKTEVKEYGINNSLITISVEITVEMMVILPFTSNDISITNLVPISIKLIQGKVPKYYSGILE